MAWPVTAVQDLSASRAGLTSLSAETRQIVDRHQEVESHASRKMTWVTVVLVATLALALIFLSAVHG
jgi:hypothetical protein